MLANRLVRLTRLDRLRPDEVVSDRVIALTFGARFVDEVTSGAWLVLAPVFRRAFGLSLVQVGLLTQVLTWVALGVEPFTASLIDIVSRRRLMAFGAAALAASMAVMGVSASYGVLLLGFGLFGLGSGPLAHTADVVVVESFPDAPERAFTRATFLDTTGAVLGPALVAVATVAHLPWRAVLVLLGAGCAAYALTIRRTTFPAPRGRRAQGLRVVAKAATAVVTALRRSEVRRAVLVLLCFDVFEAAFVLQFIWLHDTVRLSEAAVATWGALEQVVALVALLVLDKWLRSGRADVGLRLAAAALVLLPAVWVAAPGIWGRVVVGVPLVFVRALVWPLAKSRSLVAAPELAGAAQAVTTLIPLLPLAVVESALAQAIGVGHAMAVTAAVGAAAMLVAAGGRGRR